MTTSFRVPALRFPVAVTLALPGSKSQANRAIVCAALAQGTTTIVNATPCDDVSVMVENLQKLGFDLSWVDKEKGVLRIKGGIPHASDTHHSSELDCHNAGTTIRFLTSVACIVPGTWTLTGDAHMLQRPIHDLLHALRSLGADIEDTQGGFPITVKGGSLRGGTVTLKADISSQYLSSLLLIGPALRDGLTVELSGPLTSVGYVELTRRVLADFGSTVVAKGHGFSVPSSLYRAKESYEVEGDWSAAGAWLVLAALTGSTCNLTNISRTSEQSDRHLPGLIASLQQKGDIDISVTKTPDQLMNLAVFAAYRTGTTRFIGARNLRYKECDRLHVLTTELRKAGVDIDEHDDGVIVRGSRQRLSSRSPRPIVLNPHNDHRMAMCFTILGLLRGNITVKNAACVAKSYPGFYDDLHRILTSAKPIAIVGMRGSGKSSLARRLARTLKLQHVDSDHLFVDRHGPIAAYVSKHGWRAFRDEEAKIIAECLRPGIVLSCGGGAVESASVRKKLTEETVCVWLQAKTSVLMERLKSGKRPPLTNLPLADEVATLLKERTPHYRDVSKITVPASVSFSRQGSYLVSSLRDFVRSYDLHTRSYS